MPDEHSPASMDRSQPVATRHDLSRQAATSDEYISIKDARQIFFDHKRKVTERTLQRYCEKQHLDGRKMLTAEGEKWFVLKSSVLTRIKELDEFDKLRPVATSDDMSAPVADEIATGFHHDSERQATTDSAVPAPVAEADASATTSDETRPVATSRDAHDKDDAVPAVVTVRMDEREKELYERVITMQATTIDGLMKDKGELYKLLETANQEKRLLIESDRDTKGIVKNNNSLMAYLSNFFKGRDALEAPMHEASPSERSNLTDSLPGDERYPHTRAE